MQVLFVVDRASVWPFEIPGSSVASARAYLTDGELTRLSVEHRRLWHDPRRRECSLASVTSLEFDGDRLVGVRYSEPAAELLPGAAQVAGA